MVSKEDYNRIKTLIYCNARHLEICLWKYYFEEGKKEDVILALQNYQNEDGGFGNALEPDNWNPNSTPYTTMHAISILKEVEFVDLTHPIYQGILKYLSSGSDLLEQGWRFNVPSNNLCPHAPWWDYNEEANKSESIGITAGIVAFVLKYVEHNTSIYERCIELAKYLCDKLMGEDNLGDMGIYGLIELVQVLEEVKMPEFDYELLQARLHTKVKNSIEHDISKWQYYGVRPSNYITSPQSIYYMENKEIVEQELTYLEDTLPENDLWGITWTWFNHNEEYSKEFAISENWWKSIKAIEKLRYLRAFGQIDVK